MGVDGIAAERALTKEGKNTSTNLHIFNRKANISYHSCLNYEISFENETGKLEMVDMLAAFQPISPPFIICRKTNSSKWPQHSIWRRRKIRK